MFHSVIRALRYIIKGIPNNYITAEVSVNNSGKLLLNKRIVVTGGSKGIGFAIAKKCIAEGARVLICGRDLNSLEKAQKELAGGSCEAIQFDINDISGIDMFLKSAEEKLGGVIDCLVNNAGISYHEKNFREVTEEGFDKQFDTNFKAGYFMAKCFVELKEKQNTLKGSNILFVSSERGSFYTDIPYGITKASINCLVGGLNNRLAAQGVRVNAIAPGVTTSEMTGRKRTEDMSYSGSPIGRVLLPEEIAEVASFLLSDSSSCISGEIIHCDNGSHLKSV